MWCHPPHPQTKNSKKTVATAPKYNPGSTGPQWSIGPTREEVNKREVTQVDNNNTTNNSKELTAESLQKESTTERVGARSRSRRTSRSWSRPSSPQGRGATPRLASTSPRKGRGRELSYHGIPLEQLSARELGATKQRPRTGTSQSSQQSSGLVAQRAVRRPTTASEKVQKAGARRRSATPGAPREAQVVSQDSAALQSEQSPVKAAAREAESPLKTKLRDALPAWTVRDLDTEPPSPLEASESEDVVPALGLARDGRLQVHLTGFPRQRIRLSADQGGGNLSILLNSQRAGQPAGGLPGAVQEEAGSLHLLIEEVHIESL